MMDWFWDLYARQSRVTQRAFAYAVGYLITIPLMLGVLYGGLWLFDALPSDAQAAPTVQSVDDGDLPPCTPIAATGSIVISRCEDMETGHIIFVNNIGFLDVVEQ